LSSLENVDNKPDLLKSALHWYTLAVNADPQLGQLAVHDSDLVWLREQQAYKNVQQALMTIDVAVENE